MNRAGWAEMIAADSKGKVCVDCGALHTRKGGATRCADCAKARHLAQQAEWRADHRQVENAKNRARYARTRRDRAAYFARRWRELHPVETRVCAREGCDIEFPVGAQRGKKRFHDKDCQQLDWYERNRPRIVREQKRQRRLARAA